jgi:hypothetical protein
MATAIEQTVLDPRSPFHSTHGMLSYNKPKLVEFYGMEGEDFRYFRRVLENFFELANVTSDRRRVTILKTQLRRAAATFFNNVIKARNQQVNATELTYSDAMTILQDNYITERLLMSYENAFNDMTQQSSESPELFLSRLYEAADLANFDNVDTKVFGRFRGGLLPKIRKHCIKNQCVTLKEWTSRASAYWAAKTDTAIHLVDNPFEGYGHNSLKMYGSDLYETEFGNSSTHLLSQARVNGNNNGNSKNVVNVQPSMVQSIKSVSQKGNGENLQVRSTVDDRSAIASLTARMEALELNQLIIPGEKEKSVDLYSGEKEKLPISKEDLKAFIQSVVQEVKKDNAIGKEDVRNYYHDDYYDGRNGYGRDRRRRRRDLYQDNYGPNGYYSQPYNPPMNGPGYNNNNYNQNNGYQNSGYSNGYNHNQSNSNGYQNQGQYQNNPGQNQSNHGNFNNAGNRNYAQGSNGRTNGYPKN